MRGIIETFALFLEHIYNNITNYLLLVGLFLILLYIYIIYGIPSTILGVGIVSILIAVIVELNKINIKKR